MLSSQAVCQCFAVMSAQPAGAGQGKTEKGSAQAPIDSVTACMMKSWGQLPRGTAREAAARHAKKKECTRPFQPACRLMLLVAAHCSPSPLTFLHHQGSSRGAQGLSTKCHASPPSQLVEAGYGHA